MIAEVGRAEVAGGLEYICDMRHDDVIKYRFICTLQFQACRIVVLLVLMYLLLMDGSGFDFHDS